MAGVVFGLGGRPSQPVSPPPRGLRRVAGDPPRCSACSTRAQGARRGAADVRRSGGTRGAEGEGEWFGGASTRTWGRAGGGGRPPGRGGWGAPSNPADVDVVVDWTPSLCQLELLAPTQPAARLHTLRQNESFPEISLSGGLWWVGPDGIAQLKRGCYTGRSRALAPRTPHRGRMAT